MLNYPIEVNKMCSFWCFLGGGYFLYIEVEYLFYGTSPLSESCLLFWYYLFRLWLEYVNDNLHNHVCLADKTDCHIVITLLEVFIFYSDGPYPVCQIVLQITVRLYITSCPPQLISSSGIFSMPAAFAFANGLFAAAIYRRSQSVPRVNFFHSAICHHYIA